MQIDSGQRVVGPGAIEPAASGDFLRLAGALEVRLEELTVETVERLRESLPAWIVQTVVGEEEIAEFVRASLGMQL
ncbi:MAG TPA: hypothetical protein VHR65_07210, partial [Solirubrobacterales bacterium]|nr:hypothetical protein [Solirubrobacterales bacterium]